MKKKIFFKLLVIIVSFLLLVIIGRYFYKNRLNISNLRLSSPVESEEPMNQPICESDGGEWVSEHISTKEGPHKWAYYCWCKSSLGKPWIDEGKKERCP